MFDELAREAARALRRSVDGITQTRNFTTPVPCGAAFDRVADENAFNQANRAMRGTKHTLTELVP